MIPTHAAINQQFPIAPWSMSHLSKPSTTNSALLITSRGLFHTTFDKLLGLFLYSDCLDAGNSGSSKRLFLSCLRLRSAYTWFLNGFVCVLNKKVKSDYILKIYTKKFNKFYFIINHSDSEHVFNWKHFFGFGFIQVIFFPD